MTIPPPPAPPPAFRLKRPYESEDEFVAGDGHALGKGGMVLIGAGPRPAGLIVRFEIALRDGSALFRGEGKVVAHRIVADDGLPPGLEIRFTRLDARGKSIVDRALRAQAAALSPTPPPAIPDLTPPPERVAAVPAAIPSPAIPVELISDEHVEPPTVPAMAVAPPAEPRPSPVVTAAVPEADHTERVDFPPDPERTEPIVIPAARPSPPSGRDALLARLRGGKGPVTAPDAGSRAALLERLRAR